MPQASRIDCVSTKFWSRSFRPVHQALVFLVHKTRIAIDCGRILNTALLSNIEWHFVSLGQCQRRRARSKWCTLPPCKIHKSKYRIVFFSIANYRYSDAVEQYRMVIIVCSDPTSPTDCIFPIGSPRGILLFCFSFVAIAITTVDGRHVGTVARLKLFNVFVCCALGVCQWASERVCVWQCACIVYIYAIFFYIFLFQSWPKSYTL